jgi:hypothetical protein
MQTMRDQIVGRIKRLGEGKAFSAKDFLDIASGGTIDMTLGSPTRNGTIRRIRRGEAAKGFSLRLLSRVSRSWAWLWRRHENGLGVEVQSNPSRPHIWSSPSLHLHCMK